MVKLDGLGIDCGRVTVRHQGDIRQVISRHIETGNEGIPDHWHTEVCGESLPSAWPEPVDALRLPQAIRRRWTVNTGWAWHRVYSFVGVLVYTGWLYLGYVSPIRSGRGAWLVIGVC